MAIFKLKRFEPKEIEIQITDKQLIQMFPIELHEHPFMGEISRQWITDNQHFSIENASEDQIVDLSKDTKHIQMKKEVMEDILSHLIKFKIILYYEDKEDVYEVQKISE